MYHADLLTEWRPDPMEQHDAPQRGRAIIRDFEPKTAECALDCDRCAHIILPGSLYWQDDTAYWYCSPSCGRLHILAGRE